MDVTKVVPFQGEGGEVSHRRLADLPNRVVEGDPKHETNMRFSSPDGALVGGVWTSTPGTWHAFTDRDEYCFIVSGHCRLIDESGDAQEFRTGDGFLIPNGFRGYWDVIDITTKHFVIRHHQPD